MLSIIQRNRVRSALKASILCLVLLSGSAHALKSDRTQPVNIESAEQYADLQSNKLVFSGDVVVTQGSMKINADKIEVLRTGGGSLKSVTAYGSPVMFEQKQDNGTYIRSRSSKLSYNPESTKIVLQGRVTIRQGESKITGEQIEYNITTQKLYATNRSQGGRVSSTFVPSELSGKASDKN